MALHQLTYESRSSEESSEEEEEEESEEEQVQQKPKLDADGQVIKDRLGNIVLEEPSPSEQPGALHSLPLIRSSQLAKTHTHTHRNVARRKESSHHRSQKGSADSIQEAAQEARL